MSAPATPRASTPARQALGAVFTPIGQAPGFATPRSRIPGAPPAIRRQGFLQAASPSSDGEYSPEMVVFSPLCVLTPPPRNPAAYLSPNSASSTPASYGLPALAFSPSSHTANISPQTSIGPSFD